MGPDVVGRRKTKADLRAPVAERPDIIVMDEATAALDEKSQDKMMQTVIDELPDATIISVAHRPELEAFHSRKITLERREGGAKLVSDIDLIPARQGQAPCCAEWSSESEALAGTLITRYEPV